MADLVTRLLLNNTNFNSNIQASTKELMAFRRQAETVSSGLSLEQNQTFGDNFGVHSSRLPRP